MPPPSSAKPKHKLVDKLFGKVKNTFKGSSISQPPSPHTGSSDAQSANAQSLSVTLNPSGLSSRSTSALPLLPAGKDAVENATRPEITQSLLSPPPSGTLNRVTSAPNISYPAIGTAVNSAQATTAQFLVPPSSPSAPPNRTDDTPSTLPPTSPAAEDTATPSDLPLLLDPSPTKASLVSREELKEAGRLAWNGFKVALEAVKESTDAFPLLKSPVAAFLQCVKIVESVIENPKDYAELAREMTVTLKTLEIYKNEIGWEENETVERIAKEILSITADIETIGEKQSRSKTQRTMEVNKDKEDMIKHYRHIEALFRELQNDMNLRTLRNTNTLRVLKLLKRMYPVKDAKYDSAYSRDVKRRHCTPETRAKVLEELRFWAQDPTAAKVYWMNGMAGTGKTTIAYSLCQWLEENTMLGGSFFCSRTSISCRSLKGIIPTIAYQLAQYSPLYRALLCKVLEDNPDAADLDVVPQFTKLVKEPLVKTGIAMPANVVVVIDALDECDDIHGVQRILGLLLRDAADLPLKFFVTSRPEPVIHREMQSKVSHPNYPPSVLRLHDIEKSIVQGDIRKFIIEAFSDFPLTPTEIDELVNRAGKLFIYAATVVQYIMLNGQYKASRLQSVLKESSQPTGNGVNNRSDKRFTELDKLYSTILAGALNKDQLEDEEIDAIRLLLHTAVCSIEPMTLATASSILDLPERDLTDALEPLKSVLYVSVDTGLISTLHASFPDYLFDERRSQTFHCDEKQHNGVLAGHCLRVMKAELKFNICGLESSFVQDEDVPDLDERVKNLILPPLVYGCRYWGEHLARAGIVEALQRDALHVLVGKFLEQRLLFWMEVLNLGKWLSDGVSLLFQAQTWLSKNNLPGHTIRQASDARVFVTQFIATSCPRSTPHLYLSALTFCSQSSSVYHQYRQCIQGVRDVKGSIMNQRDEVPLAVWSTGSACSSISFSSDGTRIVSASKDNTIRVWNALSGEPIGDPFKGHTDSVSSVAFSPDGTRIVSGSKDKTIRVWNALSGEPIGDPFTGHTKSVSSVAFSPDGTRIVSGSWDKTIRVWNALSGEPIGDPFKGHTNWVSSIAFSPDGTRIVSGFYDETIRVWNALSGEPIGDPFKGHTNSVSSVAFSPDGTQIISGSWDKTIRVWNALSGEPIGDPFKGHTNWVSSVAFSPDGTRIVSGSYDETIRVWNALSGEPIGDPFKGHTNSVSSVAFSPDGTRIISGSWDNTIRVWNALSGEPIGDPFKGHTNWVSSVAFSPEGTRIISGSWDKTIRVWNALSGEPIGDPFKGHTNSVNSVAFSPDGTRIVSGSYDETIRVWNALSGEPIGDPFKGHTSIVSDDVENSPVHSPSLPLQIHLSNYWNCHWTLKDDGWITHHDSLLFWTPPDLHKFLGHPSSTLAITPKGTISVDYSDLLPGDRWAECWIAK